MALVEEVTVRFIQQCGFTCPPDKVRDMQGWLAANEEKLAASCPEGVRYLGTFTAVYTSEKDSGGFVSFFEFDSYGAQDRMAEALKDGGTFGAMMDEFGRLFVDQDPKADWSMSLYKRVTDAAIFGV